MESSKPQLRRNEKIQESIEQLELALELYTSEKNKEKKELFFLTSTKAYEVLIEYGWKELKKIVENEGLEAGSPKEAVRQAAVLGLTKEPELWIRAINARNLSMHDYFQISEKDFIVLISQFLKLIQKEFLE